MRILLISSAFISLDLLRFFNTFILSCIRIICSEKSEEKHKNITVRFFFLPPDLLCFKRFHSDTLKSILPSFPCKEGDDQHENILVSQPLSFDVSCTFNPFNTATHFHIHFAYYLWVLYNFRNACRD